MSCFSVVFLISHSELNYCRIGSVVFVACIGVPFSFLLSAVAQIDPWVTLFDVSHSTYLSCFMYWNPLSAPPKWDELNLILFIHVSRVLLLHYFKLTQTIEFTCFFSD